LRLVSRERISTNSTVLGSAPAMQQCLPNRELAGFFVDLAHRNQTKASCDAQIRGTLSTGSSVPMKIDPTLGGGNKRYRLRGEVDLPACFPMAGGAGEATCAACRVSSFMVVEHSRRSRRGQVPRESAVDFVAVGRKPVKGANVCTIADVLVQFSGPGVHSQMGRVSENDRVSVDSARGQKLRSFNVPRESGVERHHLAGCCGDGCRDKHCRKEGEEKRDQNPCCWFELNVSIFHSVNFLFLFWVCGRRSS